jgi:chromosome segregation ATPase
MSWDKKRDLAEIQAAGKHALREYDEHGRAKAQAKAEITALERQVGRIDAQAAAMVPLKPRTESFATDDELSAWQDQLDELMAQRTQLMNQRRDFTAVVAQHRTAMIKLAKAYEDLQRAQRNLEAVVQGRSPATGWEGGVYPVP